MARSKKLVPLVEWPKPPVPPRTGAALTTLAELLVALKVIEARGAGQLPVLIQTRNQFGDVIYGEAHARVLTLYFDDGRFRDRKTETSKNVEVVCVG